MYNIYFAITSVLVSNFFIVSLAFHVTKMVDPFWSISIIAVKFKVNLAQDVAIPTIT